MLKSWCSILLLVFSFWICSSRVIWIFCTLLRLALNERYRLANNARLPISEMLKTIDKNIIQNNRLFWTWYILPLRSSVSAFSNDPNKWVVLWICFSGCPGLCNQSTVTDPNLLEMKIKKPYLSFIITKIWQTLKRFSRHVCQAQTLKLLNVLNAYMIYPDTKIINKKRFINSNNTKSYFLIQRFF